MRMVIPLLLAMVFMSVPVRADTQSELWMSPTGDGASFDWQRIVYADCADPQHYCELTENPANDGNTSFLFSPAVGGVIINDTHTYTTPAFPDTIVSIDSVRPWIHARLNGSGDGTMWIRTFVTDIGLCGNSTLTFGPSDVAFANWTGSDLTTCGGNAWTTTMLNTMRFELLAWLDGITPGFTVTSEGFTVTYTIGPENPTWQNVATLIIGFLFWLALFGFGFAFRQPVLIVLAGFVGILFSALTLGPLSVSPWLSLIFLGGNLVLLIGGVIGLREIGGRGRER